MSRMASFDSFNVDALEIEIAADKLDLSALVTLLRGEDEAAAVQAIEAIQAEAHRSMVHGYAQHLALLKTVAKVYGEFSAKD